MMNSSVEITMRIRVALVKFTDKHPKCPTKNQPNPAKMDQYVRCFSGPWACVFLIMVDCILLGAGNETGVVIMNLLKMCCARSLHLTLPDQVKH